MNEFDLEKRLNEKFQEYMIFLHGGGIYPAIQILAGINNCIPKLKKTEQNKWLKLLHSEKIDKDSLQIIMSELRKDIYEIKRLLSIFNVWIVEELVLVLTLRIQVDLVIALLDEMNLLIEDIDLQNIDKKILEISIANKSKLPFKSSVNLINKNWGLPIRNKWLDKSIKKIPVT